MIEANPGAQFSLAALVLLHTATSREWLRAKSQSV
jgi:hypothetical protein